jgi:hypothetical protein
MLKVYVSNVSPILDVCCKCFIYMLHMLQRYLYAAYVVTHSDSRARMRCTHPYSAAYLCHAGSSNNRMCTQQAVSVQKAEHSLIKVRARM